MGRVHRIVSPVFVSCSLESPPDGLTRSDAHMFYSTTAAQGQISSVPLGGPREVKQATDNGPDDRFGRECLYAAVSRCKNLPAPMIVVEIDLEISGISLCVPRVGESKLGQLEIFANKVFFRIGMLIILLHSKMTFPLTKFTRRPLAHNAETTRTLVTLLLLLTQPFLLLLKTLFRVSKPLFQSAIFLF